MNIKDPANPDQTMQKPERTRIDSDGLKQNLA